MNSNSLGNFERERKVSLAVLGIEHVEVECVRHLAVYESAKGHSVGPARREVRNVYVRVALGSALAPLEHVVFDV
jgi:hypothetical protein